MTISNVAYNLIDYLVDEAAYYGKERYQFNGYPVDSSDLDEARRKLIEYIEKLEAKQ